MYKNIWLYPFGLYGLAFIVNQKWINKIYKQGKVDGTIPICLLQLDPGTKKKTKMKLRYVSRKMVFKLDLGSKLDWKIVETF